MTSTLVPADPFAGLPPGDADWLRSRTSAALALCRRTAEDIVEMGGIFRDVKSRLDHGRFLLWLRAALPFSHSTVVRMMQVADKFGGQILHGATIDPAALYLLCQSSTSPEARQMALDLAGQGHRITKSAALNIIRRAVADAAPAPSRPSTGSARASPAERIGAAVLALEPPDPDGEATLTVRFGLDGEGDRLVSAAYQPSDPARPVARSTGRDLAEVLSALAPAPGDAGPFVVDPEDYRKWARSIARGVRKDYGFRAGSQEEKDVEQTAAAELVRRCRLFDPAHVRPDSTVEDAFKGWAYQYVRSECVREAERLRNAGTYHTRRGGPAVVVQPLPEDAG